MDCTTQIIKLIKPLCNQKTPLTKSTSLVEDLGLSSLEVMELIEQLEDYFDIAVPLNNLEDLKTLGDLASRIQVLLEVAE